MHIPVNHPARRFYRVIAALVGVYILVFGLVGLVQNWGDPLFARDSTWTLGLRTNLGVRARLDRLGCPAPGRRLPQGQPRRTR